MFIETEERNIINLDHVISIKPYFEDRKTGNKYRYDFTLSNGDKISGHCDEFLFADSLNTMMSTIIPAETGYKAVSAEKDDNGNFFIEMPVIAWAIARTGEIKPLAPFFNEDDRPDILLPDGRVVDPDNFSISNDFESWKTEHIKNR